MKNRQKGIILFNSMMMIGLCSLIVVSQMQLISLQFKSVNHFLHRHHLFKHLEIEANRLLTASLEDGWSPDCVIHETNSDVLVKRLKRKEGCSVFAKKQQFNFFIEELGVFPCVQTVFNSISYGTRHRRLTIIAIAPQPIILQLRFASLAEDGDCEQNERVYINTGITSWRYIN